MPTLVLDDGEALIESAMILDHLDDVVGPDKAMIAPRGETRRRHLRICALAMGLGDKGVSLLYERVLRKEKQLDLWVERCKSQISGVLEVLEKERAAVKTPYWFGEKSAMPISRSPACCASPVKRILRCSTRAIPR